MNEAPKILWLDSDGYTARSRHIYECDTKYIRTDVIDELVKKLEIALQVFRTYQAYHEYRDAFDKADRNKGYAEQMEAALELLEEE